MHKICIIVPAHWDAFKGGAEYQADCLAEYIAKMNKYNVIYLARDVSDTTTNHSYKLSKIPTLFKHFKYGLFWDAYYLARALKQINPDVVLQHVGCAYTGVASYFCKKYNKRMIWYLASDIDVEKRKLSFMPKRVPGVIDNLFLNYGTKNTNVIVAQTKKQAKLLEKNYSRQADYVIPNFHPPCKHTISKDDNLNVIWVANIKKLKQPEIFVKLARDLIGYENITFTIIGRRENSEWCDILLKEVGSLDNIKYLGEMDINLVNAEFEKAHLLVNSSTYEGFPNTFIQGWMREVPTLSLNVDPDSVIRKHNLGFHAGSYENMKRYIIDMYNDRDQLRKTGLQARKFAEENYSMKNADRVIDVIIKELSLL